MNIPGLNPSQFIPSNASVGLCMDLLFVVTCLKRREDQISIVHNLKPRRINQNSRKDGAKYSPCKLIGFQQLLHLL